MVERCLAFLCIVGYDHVEIQQRHTLLGSGLHHTDAPIDIGRIAVLQVEGCSDGEVGTGIEGLMTDKHALTEGFPRQMVRGRESAMVQEAPFLIDDIRVAIEYGRELPQGTVPL